MDKFYDLQTFSQRFVGVMLSPGFFSYAERDGYFKILTGPLLGKNGGGNGARCPPIFLAR